MRILFIIIAYTLILLLSVGCSRTDTNTPSSEKVVTERADFDNNKPIIIAEAKVAQSVGDYEKVREIISPYVANGDGDIDALVAWVKREHDVARNKAALENLERIKHEAVEIAINDIDNTKISDYLDTPANLSKRREMYDNWLAVINMAPKNSQKSKILKEKLSKLQAKEFPILREQFAKFLHERLWEHNIDVRTLGGKHTSLEHVGAYYAHRGNIKESMEDSYEQFHRFRFKQSRYTNYWGQSNNSHGLALGGEFEYAY